jgi:hypothetical protein
VPGLVGVSATAWRTAPPVAEARRELDRKTVAEYANQWRPRRRRMAEYSTVEHVDGSSNVQFRAWVYGI